MLKIVLIFFLAYTNPVLYEGRYCPLETLPEEASYSVLEVNDYSTLAGKPYLQAVGKTLYYPSKWQLQAELFLHKVPLKWIILAAYLLGACCTLLKKKKWALMLLIMGFSLHTSVLALRCYILCRPPVSNMAETLLYVPWIALIIGFLFHTRREAIACAACVSAILLGFLPAKSTLENVPAVLDSQYWLIVHVLMVVGSYGIFLVAGLLGHLYWIKKNPSPALEKTLIQMLYLGTALLICGTILGGVWAAQSWGRFWDWDPKEAWAFISSGTYLIVIHAYRFKKIGGRGLALGAILGLLSITFTWYGVNYILGSGLHSYGFGNGGELYYYLYMMSEVLFLAWIALKKKPKVDKRVHFAKKGK